MQLQLRLSALDTHSQRAKIQNCYKLGFAVVSSSSLAALIVGLGAKSAAAQLTIQSTGTISGTIQLPSFNPNFNNRVTRVDTNSTGTYYRNEGTLQNPNYVPVYSSNFVKVQTRADGSLRYFVDFKGIPVVSFDGVLTSPVLSGGDLTPYTYQGKLPNTKFQGVVQDEFGLTKAFYTGIVTDPKTGQQYQGTFQLSGQGPRYSDRNGNASPTVFDFKSDIPGKPTVKSQTMTDTPLVKLTITVPANAIVTPSGGGSTPTTGGGGSTPTSSGSGTTPTPPTSLSPTPPTSPSPTPSATPNMEFSSGNSTLVLDPSTVAAAICSPDSIKCRTKPSTPKQAIGPRSRVLLR